MTDVPAGTIGFEATGEVEADGPGAAARDVDGDATKAAPDDATAWPASS